MFLDNCTWLKMLSVTVRHRGSVCANATPLFSCTGRRSYTSLHGPASPPPASGTPLGHPWSTVPAVKFYSVQFLHYTV